MFCLFPRKICFKPMVDIVLHYFIHRITNWSVLLLQILQFFLQQNIVLKSLRLLLISHGCCCWCCCCCGGRSRCCLLTGWRSPVWGGVIPILPINLIKIEASNLFNEKYFLTYFCNIVKVIAARNQFIIKIKLHQLVKRRIECLVESDDVVGKVDVEELYPGQTHGPVHVLLSPGHPYVVGDLDWRRSRRSRSATNLLKQRRPSPPGTTSCRSSGNLRSFQTYSSFFDNWRPLELREKNFLIIRRRKWKNVLFQFSLKGIIISHLWCELKLELHYFWSCFEILSHSFPIFWSNHLQIKPK